MVRVVIPTAVLCLITVSGPVSAAWEEAPDAYEIVARASTPLLPTPLGEFFTAHLDALQQAAIAEMAPASFEESTPEEARRHYVMLDVTANGDARRFPKGRAEALRLFQQHGVQDGGELPWVILERYGALVRAFKSGADDAVITEGGRLLHFATDATMPFNTTHTLDTGDELRRAVRQRCQQGLLERLHKRFAVEVRVSPGRLRITADPERAVFDALFDAHDTVAELVKIDADVLTELDISDVSALTASKDAYYQRLADRAAPIMETRLEAAALLSAGLITGAWTEAGRPELHATPPEPVVSEDRLSPAKSTKSAYVGSRTSMTFHKAGCPHARRIKPENLVGFDSVKEALRAGRKPCKTCKPDQQ